MRQVLLAAAMAFFVFALIPWMAVAQQSQRTRWQVYGNNTILILGQTYSGYYFTQCHSYSYYAVYFYYPCNDLTVSILPSTGGSPQLYVSRANLDQDPYPTKDKMTWGGNQQNYYAVTISRWDPMGAPGWYYVGVYNDCSQQNSTAWYQIQAIMNPVPMFGQNYATHPELEDLMLYPQLGMNKQVQLGAYSYFRFCVPYCANVEIGLKTNSPGLEYPQIVVSRTEENPTVQSLAFKLTDQHGSLKRRRVWLNASDPSARDRNGNNQGSYYLAVHGSCPPGVWACSLSSIISAKVTYSINITLHAVHGASAGRDFGRCPSFTTLLPSEPAYPALGNTPSVATSVSGNVHCRNGVADYAYYRMPVSDPCASMSFALTTQGSGSNGVANMAISRYPNVAPQLNGQNLAWTANPGYGSTSMTTTTSSLSISVWDPNFDGGMVCGADQKSLCYLYVGITGACSPINTGNTTIPFVLTSMLTPATGIFAKPQSNQSVAANGATSYRFCTNANTPNVALQLNSYTSSCNCPDSFAQYDVVVSLYNPAAGINDVTWLLRGGDPTGFLNLSAADADTRPGSYYVNVLGRCTAFGVLPSGAAANPCRSAPCTNVRHSPYALYVGSAVGFPKASTAATMALPACHAHNRTVVAGPTGMCAATCPASASLARSPVGLGGTTAATGALSTGGQIAVAVVIVVLFLSVVGCCIWRHKTTTHNRFHADNVSVWLCPISLSSALFLTPCSSRPGQPTGARGRRLGVRDGRYPVDQRTGAGSQEPNHLPVGPRPHVDLRPMGKNNYTCLVHFDLVSL